MEETNFEWALKQLKENKRVARKGWNGKNMFVYLVNESLVSFKDLRHDAKTHIHSVIKNSDDLVRIKGHIDMYNAQGEIVVGWVASQMDILANDWIIVEN